jgi:hypothetical protein
MQLRATRTFKSRYGMIRNGQNFTAENSYGNDLISSGKAQEIRVDVPRPARVQAFTGAERNKGKDEPEIPPDPANQNSADLKDDGQARPSALSRVGRALRRRTRTTAEDEPKP